MRKTLIAILFFFIVSPAFAGKTAVPNCEDVEVFHLRQVCSTSTHIWIQKEMGADVFRVRLLRAGPFIPMMRGGKILQKGKASPCYQDYVDALTCPVVQGEAKIIFYWQMGFPSQ